MHEYPGSPVVLGARVGELLFIRPRVTAEADICVPGFPDVAPLVVMTHPTRLQWWELILELLPGGGVSSMAIASLGGWCSMHNNPRFGIDWEVIDRRPLDVGKQMRLPMEQFERTARRYLEMQLAVINAGPVDEWPHLRAPSELLAELGAEPRQRPGRRGHDHELLAAVAADYASRIAQGDRHAARSVAENHPGWDVKYAQGLLQAARDKGILTRAPKRGVQGGELTEYGRSIRSTSLARVEPGRGPSDARRTVISAI